MLDVLKFSIGTLSGEWLTKTVCIYFASVSLWAVFLVIYDKIASKKMTQYRVRESILLFVSVIGGSIAMLASMLVIRHKTAHIKFMVGVPIIILIQVVSLWLLIHFGVITF